MTLDRFLDQEHSYAEFICVRVFLIAHDRRFSFFIPDLKFVNEAFMDNMVALH